MPLARQSTYVGPKRSTRRKASSKTMKKTTKRGAYKKGKVKNWVNRRRPFVETKTRVLSQIWQLNALPALAASGLANPTDYQPLIADQTGAVVSTGVFSHLPLNNYNFMTQVGGMSGTDQSDRMNGNSIFAKWLNVKGKIRFPVDDDIARLPQNLEMIWGWTAPMNKTTNTTPEIGELTPINVVSHVTEQVAEYFNAQVDELQFVPKRNNNLQILGRKRIRPDISKTYQAPPTALAGTTTQYTGGVVPDFKFNVSFKIMKKIHYDAGGEVEYSSPNTNPRDRAFINNDQRIPFVVFYQPDEGILYPGDEDKRPAVAYNSILYFSDS